MVVSVSWLLWIWNSSSSLRNSEMANRDKIIKPEYETEARNTITSHRCLSRETFLYQKQRKMRQDGCIRKLGGELQIKHVKFVNSSLQSVI